MKNVLRFSFHQISLLFQFAVVECTYIENAFFLTERHKIFSFKRFQVKLAYLSIGRSNLVAATCRGLTSNFLSFHIRLLGEECRVKVLNEKQKDLWCGCVEL